MNQLRTFSCRPFAVLLLALAFANWAAAQETVTPPTGPSEASAGESKAKDREALYGRFTERMQNLRLRGHYTIVGKPIEGPLDEEEYLIQSVRKMPEGDLWLFNARIRYGETDLTLPIPLEVKWAGETPVITLSETTIPGLGTFSARVVLHKDKYAGTWTHGEVGGHLFGVLEKAPAEAAPAAPPAQ